MKEPDRNQIADALEALSRLEEWDAIAWRRCHELVQANLDDEVLASFYHELLAYPGLFNFRTTVQNSGGTKVSIVPIKSDETVLSEHRKRLREIADALRCP